MTTLRDSKASRHRGRAVGRFAVANIKASSRAPLAVSRGPAPHLSRLTTRAFPRAFSLIEVLLAIFILGVGVISIAALFPAGIAQQRLSVDDINGPIVANNAMEIIRSKLSADAFGTFEEFSTAAITATSPRYTVPGDWSWLRPGFLFGDDSAWPPAPAPALDENGSIDVFSFYAATAAAQPPANLRATEFASGYIAGLNPQLFGVPYNRAKYGNVPPRILITQNERYYPMASKAYSTNTDAVRPQYVWDCMFRRFQGRIMVAIFVYRVTQPGGGAAANYVVARGNSVPPLPVWLQLDADPGPGGSTPPFYSHGGAWDTYNQTTPPPPVDPPNPAIVLGTQPGRPYNPEDPREAWQEPRQWLIDQNNNLHRVLGQSRKNDDINVYPVWVELVRPASRMPDLPMFYLNRLPSNPDPTTTDVVSDIWYIPLVDPNGLTLTPVFAAVKEL